MRIVFLNFEKAQSILLYWIASQQETCTFKRQIFRFFYTKFSAEFTELSQMFKKTHEVIKKVLKLKQSRRPHIWGIRRLRVNSQVRNCWVV